MPATVIAERHGIGVHVAATVIAERIGVGVPAGHSCRGRT
jgi:hypothetical protein